MSRTDLSHRDEAPSPSLTDTPLTLDANVTRRAAVKSALALAASAVLFATPRIASAATATKETLDALSSAESQLDEAQKKLDALADEFQQLSVEQDKTIGQIEDVQDQIEDTQSKIDKKRDQIDDKQDQIEEKQDQIEAQQEVLSNRVSSSYKSGPARTLDLILSAKSFDELISNAHYVEKVNDNDKRIIDEIHAMQDELAQEKAELEKQKADLEKQKERLQQQKAELEKLKDEQADRLEQMQGKQEETSQIINGLSQDVKDLMAKRDAEYLASAQEEERQRQAEEAARRASQGGATYIPGNGQSSGSAAGGQQRVVACCHSVPSPGGGLCAMWVSQVFAAAGFPYYGGNANDMYNAYCTSSNKSGLKVGMIIAVSSHPHTYAGRTYGHIGIYVGDNTVMDNIGYIRTINVDEWISYYGATVTPRWGWVGGVAPH